MLLLCSRKLVLYLLAKELVFAYLKRRLFVCNILSLLSSDLFIIITINIVFVSFECAYL